MPDCWWMHRMPCRCWDHGRRLSLSVVSLLGVEPGSKLYCIYLVMYSVHAPIHPLTPTQTKQTPVQPFPHLPSLQPRLLPPQHLPPRPPLPAPEFPHRHNVRRAKVAVQVRTAVGPVDLVPLDDAAEAGEPQLEQVEGGRVAEEEIGCDGDLCVGSSRGWLEGVVGIIKVWYGTETCLPGGAQVDKAVLPV